MPKPSRNILRFIESTRHKAVRGVCYACNHPDREAIEADTRQFLDARSRKETAYPVSSFFTEYVCKEYPYTGRFQSFKNHWSKCLGTPID